MGHYDAGYEVEYNKQRARERLYTYNSDVKALEALREVHLDTRYHGKLLESFERIKQSISNRIIIYELEEEIKALKNQK